MASNGNGRGGLLSAGGVLSIVVGAWEVISGGIIVALKGITIPARYWGIGPVPEVLITTWLPPELGGVLLILGIVAIAGGISAIRRKRFGLSLAGAICTLLWGILGILAVIFVSLGKREFETE